MLSVTKPPHHEPPPEPCMDVYNPGHRDVGQQDDGFLIWCLHRLREYQFALLVLFTLFCLGMWGSRYYVLDSLRLRFLVWNLFLAWLPFWFGLGALWCLRAGRRGLAAGLGLLWFLFFPNAPYLLTDLMHVRSARRILWFDTLLLTAYALHGLFLGLIALRMLHDGLRLYITRSRLWCWTALGTMMMLSGFAIYLGRFLRINSWDALLRPWWIGWLLWEHVWTYGKGMRIIEVTLICFGLQMLSYLFFWGRETTRRGEAV